MTTNTSTLRQHQIPKCAVQGCRRYGFCNKLFNSISESIFSRRHITFCRLLVAYQHSLIFLLGLCLADLNSLRGQSRQETVGAKKVGDGGCFHTEDNGSIKAVYFTKPIGERVDDHSVLAAFGGQWYERFTPRELDANEMEAIAAMAESAGETVDAVRRRLFPDVEDKLYYSPVGVSREAQLVFGNLQWNPELRQFTVQNTAWDVYKENKLFLMASETGNSFSIYRVALELHQDKFGIYEPDYDLFMRALDESAVDGKPITVVDGVAINLENNSKLQVFIANVGVERCFRPQPLSMRIRWTLDDGASSANHR